MEFFLFFVISISLLKSVKKYSQITLGKAFIICSPFILMWCIICGGQYCIGTDYLEYLLFFNGKNLGKMLNDGELGLPWFVKICNFFSFEGQDLFFILAFIWCILFLYFCLQIATKKYLYLYFFFFVAFTNFFNNQLNGIRQATAVYLSNAALVMFLNRRYYDFKIKHLLLDKNVRHSILFMFLAVMWHRSAFFMLFMFPFLRNYKCYEVQRIYYIYLVACIVGSILISDEFLMNIVSRIDIYANYIKSDYMFKKMTSLNMAVRYLNLIPFLLSIYYFPRYNLSNKQKIFYFLGVLGEGVVLLSVRNSLIVRFTAYFTFFSIYPLITLMDYLISSRRIRLYNIIYITYFVFYSFKVLFWAQGEYKFDSVFYHYF